MWYRIIKFLTTDPNDPETNLAFWEYESILCTFMAGLNAWLFTSTHGLLEIVMAGVFVVLAFWSLSKRRYWLWRVKMRRQILEIIRQVEQGAIMGTVGNAHFLVVDGEDPDHEG